MPGNNQHKTYTAADIEKYHKGLLSAREMNELERAALDDPFLADALEGYGHAPVNISADIEGLEAKLADRVDQAKVIPIPGRNNFYRILKIAAVIVVVAGGALLIYKLGFNNHESFLANKRSLGPNQVETRSTVAPANIDSIGSAQNGNKGREWSGNLKAKDTIKFIAPVTTSIPSKQSAPKKPPTITDYSVSNAADISTQKPGDKKEGLLTRDQAAAQPIYKGSTVMQDKAYETGRQDTVSSLRKDAANSVGVANAVLSRAKAAAIPANYFNGRIIDNNNNPVPFANVTNTRDNVGTYADANGFFTLISPDTALNLRFKSVGYLSDTLQLNSNKAVVNQVVLKEDKMNGLVLGRKRKGGNPKPGDNIRIEEPEPADGWSNYSLYLANNLQVPDPVKRKDALGVVQVSFEVNKFGDPVNVKVEKSLCKECDEEAKRLILQGPKWKLKKKKNNRVTVTVPFETTE